MSIEKTSNVLREKTFGWFPISDEKPKRSPLDIYMNLGSRHPKEECYIEEDTLKKHIKDTNSQLVEKKSNNTDQEVDPPWGLCYKPFPNKAIQNQAFLRSKSAPIAREWKPKKLPINIPKPILRNLFDKEPKHVYFNFSKKISIENEEKIKQPTSISSKLDNNEENEEYSKEILKPYTIQSFNIGKKPIISPHENQKNNLRRKKIRPKTAAFYNRAAHQGDLLSFDKRPKSTVSIRPKSSISEKRVQQENLKTSEFLKSTIETESSKIDNKNEIISEKPKNKILMENWKSNLLEREKFLHSRPDYFVKIDMNRLQPDSPAPELHYNSPDTYFYNTMPYRKATFTIDPSFISENLNVQKIDLKRKDSSVSKNTVRYRRDFAFVY